MSGCESKKVKGCPTTSPAAIVKCYEKNRAGAFKEELDSYKKRNIAWIALVRGAYDYEEIHSHHRRFYKKYEKSFLSSRDKLVKASSEIENCKNFHDLICLVKKESTFKNAELYYYDVALRIGARRELFPTEVYLHADVKKAAKTFRKLGSYKRDSFEVVKVENLPKEFKDSKPYHIEHCLCICKEAIRKAVKQRN